MDVTAKAGLLSKVRLIVVTSKKVSMKQSARMAMLFECDFFRL